MGLESHILLVEMQEFWEYISFSRDLFQPVEPSPRIMGRLFTMWAQNLHFHNIQLFFFNISETWETIFLPPAPTHLGIRAWILATEEGLFQNQEQNTIPILSCLPPIVS